MMKYKVKSFVCSKKFFFLLLMAGLIFLTVSCSRTSSSSLDFQLEDEILKTNLKGRFAVIGDDNGTSSKSIKIREIEGAYIAHIGKTKSGNRVWHIGLEGFQPIKLSVDISPGKRAIKKVLLTPTFGNLYAWGFDASDPGKPLRIPMKVRIGEFQSSVFAYEGVNISHLTPGDYTILAEVPGFIPLSQNFKIASGKESEVRLPFQGIPGHLIIFAADAKNPGKYLERELLVKVGGKDAAGKADQGVLIKDLPPGECTIEAKVEGYSTGSLNTKIISGKTVQEIILLDIATGSLKIFAKDSRYPNSPFDQNITVKLQEKMSFSKGSDGVVISGLLPGRYGFEISAQGFKTMTQSAVVTAGDTKEITVQLNPQVGGIRIIAVDARASSVPIKKRLNVEMGGKSEYGTTDEGIVIPGLPIGNYSLRAEVGGYYPAVETVEIEADKTKEIKIWLNPQLGNLKVVAKNAKNPASPLRKNLNVKVGSRENSSGADRGVIIPDLPVGRYKLEAEVDGFSSKTEFVEIEAEQTKIVELMLEPQICVLKVLVEDAKNPRNPIIKSLKVIINGKEYYGIANEGITISGLSPGSHTITAEVEGYTPGAEGTILIEGETKQVVITLSPIFIGSEAARIILKWGLNPIDLDSHLSLPRDVRLSVNHIYYIHKESQIGSIPAANLDVDDTTSFGPETTTIFNTLNGTYKFYIHHYSGSGTIGTSGAWVQVITRDGKREDFYAPVYCSELWWYVMDLEINDAKVRIIPKGQCTSIPPVAISSK